MSWDWLDLSDMLNDGGDVSDVDWDQMPEYSGAGEGIFGLETDNELAIPWTDDGSSWDSGGGFGSDFVAMFVDARLKTHGAAILFLVARPDIGERIIKRVADVRRAVDVWNCSGDV